MEKVTLEIVFRCYLCLIVEYMMINSCIYGSESLYFSLRAVFLYNYDIFTGYRVRCVLNRKMRDVLRYGTGIFISVRSVRHLDWMFAYFQLSFQFVFLFRIFVLHHMAIQCLLFLQRIFFVRVQGILLNFLSFRLSELCSEHVYKQIYFRLG